MKNKNNCDDVLRKKNEVLSSILEIVLKKNQSLKNKIASKELDLISKENISLKNDFSSHVCHATITHHLVLHAPLYFQVLKMIFVYWRIVLIVWAPLWANVLWITRNWNPCFARNMHLIFIHTILCMLMCTLVHIVDVKATL